MKLITFAVPSYNSEAYLNKCVDTLLSGGEEVEIIIVNDGSKDRTKEIADAYQAKYPSIVRAVHKPNGGHGSGVNKGLELAQGLYYKVVDSDDWVDGDALKKLLEVLRGHVAEGKNADLYITNFIYDRVSDNTSFTRRYTDNFRENDFCTWDKVKPFSTTSVLLMHAIMYRTAALRESGTILPEHTFYVDNLYAYKPLPFMKTIFYLNVDLYHYFIGRADQSVNITNIVKRYKQQLAVMRCMLDSYSFDEINKMEKGLRRYMFHNLNVIMINTLMFTLGEKSAERKKDMKELWAQLKAADIKLYKKIRFGGYPAYIYMIPGGLLRRKALVWGYLYFRKKLKLG